ncbi:xanthine dehydrogenase family protein molybdopterin-binding subunit [Pseudonocardia bannensis]|uniref:Xanthine dehydrogenase family protein molybdopterin-binding subunit n=1 Tax=Pseudonocardia bannensis TaxID=630973 RepID=A0A848DP65_9PSEU|nr:xanthine dehydrogenase family protein molybdopterin-binding subunit [Pseudonocardia bannensis]NMH94607.1 xanthine dehydrogenase family protein molybdopterin-binding subunit [Pseudonocardia bannensis]
MTALQPAPARTEATALPIGISVPRKEDERLLRGDGRFTDDVQPAHLLEMAVARCPYPHARIVSIDTSAAEQVDGVRQILVGADVLARTEPLTVLRPVPGAPKLPYYALAQEVAAHEGQPVVSVVATSRHIAEDAIELIEISYEPLPHVTDTLAALEPDAPVIHPGELASNLLVANPEGAGDPVVRLAEADVVVTDRFHVNRVTGLPMEPRAVVAQWRPGARELTVHSSTQVPHLMRKQLAEVLRIDESSIRVSASDVGGGFGLKLGIYPEDVLAALHAMTLRRPVKWVEDRMEHFRATTHAREAVHDFTIGATADGRITAMTNTYATDLGAWNSGFGSAQLSSVVFTGPYRVTDGYVERRVTVTNKTPIGAYRGYGQPEVNFPIERLVDRLARRLGMDPLELRERNMLRSDELPWKAVSGAVYDSGDYVRCLHMAAEAVDYAGLRRAGRGPRPDGRLVGVGLSSFVERTGYASARFLARRGSQFGAHESVTLRANRSGGVDLYTGVSSIGQSSETAFAQVVCGVLGIGYPAVRVHAGDTLGSPLNTGAFASRTMIAAAGALRDASLAFREKTLRIAAFRLSDGGSAGPVDPADLDVVDGEVVHRTDPRRRLRLSEVFSIAILGQGLPPEEEPGLEVTAHFEPPDAAYSFGTAAAVVAVDPDTGDYDIERFVMVHDAGTAVNPKIVEGQVRGGLVQGFGAALGEELRYDPDSGQLVNGSMMDYFAPTAADVPPIELLHTEVPSPVTTFGVRGVGEVGTIPPGAAVANAICDALADLGVELTRLPLTPESVWQAIRNARTARG